MAARDFGATTITLSTIANEEMRQDSPRIKALNRTIPQVHARLTCLMETTRLTMFRSLTKTGINDAVTLYTIKKRMLGLIQIRLVKPGVVWLAFSGKIYQNLIVNTVN